MAGFFSVLSSLNNNDELRVRKRRGEMYKRKGDKRKSIKIWDG